MKLPHSIRKSVAVLLLLLFAVSSTPKAYFHDLLANHKDKPGCAERHATSVLHKRERSCHFDDLVVTAPFLLQPTPSLEIGRLHFTQKLFAFYTAYFPPARQHSESRGPPAV